MRICRAWFADLTTSALVAVALAGLVFPGHIFAQPPGLPDLAGASPDAAVRIEVESMLPDGSLPERFSVTNGAAVYHFEYRAGGYAWWAEGQTERVNFQALPTLDETLSWKIVEKEAGSFAATLPVDSLRPSTVAPVSSFARQSVDGAKPGLLQIEALEVAGRFDASAKRADLTALGPGGELLDVSISFDAVPGELALGTSWELASPAIPGKPIFIHISIGVLLLILGLAVITCGLMYTICLAGCAIMCTYGVKSVASAICGVGCDCVCFGPPKPPPPGCSTTDTEIESLTLGGGASSPPLAASSFTLDRLVESAEKHHGQPVSFLVAEWALVSWGGGAAEVIRASSPTFAAAKKIDLAAAGAAKASAETRLALVVERPKHDANSRQIPVPAVRLAPGAVPAGTGWGEVVVRAQFDGARLQSLEVLHDTLGGVSAALRDQIARDLTVELASDASHRVDVFAVVDVKGGVSLGQALSYLPKCCCGDFYCE